MRPTLSNPAVCLLLLLTAAAEAGSRTVGSLDTQGYAQALQVEGDRVYLADGDRGLHIVDVSDPTTPRSLGTFDTSREGSAPIGARAGQGALPL